MANSVTRITTGQSDFSGGVNSNAVPTVASAENPNGLKSNQLAWLHSGTVRNSGISPRPGYNRLMAFAVGIGLLQEASFYEPDNGFPYVIAQIGGRTFKMDLETLAITEVTILGDPNPADRDQAWMCQGEQFLVIQDGVSLPLIWDGVFLRRSAGNPQVLGVVSAPAVAPAVGAPVLLTLTGPYTGAVGQYVFLNGSTYVATDGVDFIDLFRNAAGTTYNTGDTVPAGTTVTAPGQPVMTTLAPFVVPLPGNTAQDVAVNDVPPGLAPAVLVDVNGDIDSWQIPATGLPAPGANQVYLINLTAAPGAAIAVNNNITSIGEIPTAECMDYYMGRLWLALGREYLAGDIVRGPSGTAAYNYRDSILKMTENTYLALGGTFIVPTMAGNIRALKHPANIDTALGEGQLLVFTRRNIYSVNVVPTRAAWAALSEPIQRVAQINFGTMSDRSVAQVNSDLFYRAPDGIRSFIQATRLFEQLGQLPVSIEEVRAISRDDRSLLRFASGIEFDNRLLQTALPFQTDVGVAFKAILPLNFDLVSTLADKHPPAWEGASQGLDFMRLLKCDFGGRQRAFSFVREAAGNLALWEITNFEQEDTNISGDSRISWGFETASYTWGRSFELKELDTLEIWLDRVYGNVEFTVEFRPDQHPCWEPWTKWIECAPRTNCEDCGVTLPCEYPSQIYPMQYRATIVLPKPPTRCETSQSRPLTVGYSFQFRIFVKGFARVRGLMVHAFPKSKQPYLSVTEPCSTAGC